LKVKRTGGMKMSSEMQNTTSKEKGDGGKKVIIGIAVAIIVLLVSAVSVMAALLVKTNKEKEAVLSANVEQEKKQVITPENVEEVVAQMDELITPSANIPQSYTVSQNSEWVFPNGTAQSINAYVKNDESNETPMYFDLIVDETNEVVYSSPILELGAEIEKFALDKPLDAGVYVCTVLYHLVDENQNELTTVHIGVNVIVNE
jgi:hypothetical protein